MTDQMACAHQVRPGSQLCGKQTAGAKAWLEQGIQLDGQALLDILLLHHAAQHYGLRVKRVE